MWLPSSLYIEVWQLNFCLILPLTLLTTINLEVNIYYILIRILLMNLFLQYSLIMNY